MHKFTFRGGTHVNEYKNTAGCAIRKMEAPATVSIPMSQHIGAPARPIVAPGDHVYLGQVIGEVGEGLGCPVHASVSGTVREIASQNNAMGMPVENIVIENDGQEERNPGLSPETLPLSECSPERIVDIVRRAGISGMGGATFPTYAKIRGAIGKVHTVIINCAECEPFITANHRLLLEQPLALLKGASVILRALSLSEVTFAVEDNKMDAVQTLQKVIDSEAPAMSPLQARVAVMKTKYPQGDERQLIFALTGQELPAGKLPADVGCIIFNAETCAAVYRAFFEGSPLTSRVVTVDGDCIANPGNLLVPIGTSYSDVANACGGFCKEPQKVISGGPMMGFSQWDLHSGVAKGTSALLFFSEDFVRPTLFHSACIHCGRCAAHCPMHLQPLVLTDLSRKRKYGEALKMDILSCVECGTCSYNCPAGVEIVQYIRAAKGAIRQIQAAERARTAKEEEKK